jgi:ATP-binding cassette subfamily C protein
LGKEDRLQFGFLFLGILFSSLTEIVGLGLILPFIALLGRPELLMTNVWLSRSFQASHLHTFNEFMAVLAIGIAVVFIAKNVILYFINYSLTRFVFQKQTYFVCRLFSAYLMSPYSFHLRRDIGRLKYLMDSVPAVMSGVVLQILNMLTEFVLVLLLFVFLLIAKPVLTCVVMILLGGSLFLILSFLKGNIKKWGGISFNYGVLSSQVMEQGLGSFKETKLWGKELFFSEKYHSYRKEYNHYAGKNDAMLKSLRLFIEAIIVVLIMSGMAIFLMMGQSPDKLLMTLSVFAVVAVRLMPSLNRISAAWGSVKFSALAFDAIYDDLLNCERMDAGYKEMDQGEPVPFEGKIEMRNVSFFYEKTEVPAVKSISIEILKNTTVGFVGPSGAGKSTVVDIVMGLLLPSSGVVLAGGVDTRRHLRSWQKKIGYIPQMIYLCDDTIKSNIAFGVESKDINEKKVWEVLRLAQLDDFIRAQPLGINTVIGERGVRLSGGQRQRISIARALYHDPEILVMDEATAALDNETERDFMAALNSFSNNKTIIIIAHRLTTVQQCDKIFFLKDGQLVAEGKYDELLKNCPQFRDMARAARNEPNVLDGKL